VKVKAVVFFMVAHGQDHEPLSPEGADPYDHDGPGHSAPREVEDRVPGMFHGHHSRRQEAQDAYLKNFSVFMLYS
jgi:hypothetical protein